MTRSGSALNVLHVAQPGDGGVAGYVAAVSLDQAARGWNVAVACPDAGRLATDLANGGVPRLHWPAERAPGTRAVTEARRLGDLIDQRRPQVVHLHSSKAGLVGRLVVRRRLPTLFQPHGWSWLAVDGAMLGISLAWERMAARWTELFVCVGTGEAEQARSRGMGGRYTVVRNGVDLHRFRPADDDARAAARSRLGVGRNAPLAVCLGRVTRQKGQDVLISAWPRVRQMCPSAQLCVVGDGDLLPALRTRAGPGVGFAGAVTDVHGWLAAADVVVLPSRWEGLPLTALEALASGRSVIASAISGLAEVVTPGVGALVPPEDPELLARAVVCRLGNQSLARVEGVAGARHARRFDIRASFDSLAAATARVAAERGRGG
jgi:glycosyltransferase involved in cell wall biosynthesis